MTKEERREYFRQWRAKQTPESVKRHGTRNAYDNYGCRCDECRATQASYMRAYRARQAS